MQQLALQLQQAPEALLAAIHLGLPELSTIDFNKGMSSSADLLFQDPTHINLRI